MRIGITGGTGFLGRHLATRLLESGHEAVAFTRSPARARSLLPARAGIEPWDPLSGPPDPAQLDPLDAIVNLMGETVTGRWTAPKRRRIADSRVTGTRHLLQGFGRAASPPSLLLSSSAGGFYGDGADAELSEDAPAGTGFLPEVCRRWEAEAEIGRTLGARVVLLRTTLPLHPAGGFLRALLPAFRLGLGTVLGNGRQWLPWIHLEDWLSLVQFALEREEVSGPLNVTSPEPARNRAFTRTLASVLGRPALLRAPAFLLRLAAPQIADEMILISQRVVPTRARELGFSFRFPELEGALRDLLDRP
jgi:uncharacterized protein (TIGR01777 family)